MNRNKSQKRTQSLRHRSKGSASKRERPLSVAAFTQTEPSTHATLGHTPIQDPNYNGHQDQLEITFARPPRPSHDLFSIDERYLYDIDSKADHSTATPTLPAHFDARYTETRPPVSPPTSRRANSLPGQHARHNSRHKRYKHTANMPTATSTPTSPMLSLGHAHPTLNRMSSVDHSVTSSSGRNRSDSDAVSEVPSSSGSSNGLEYTVVTIVLPDEREYQLSCESRLVNLGHRFA